MFTDEIWKDVKGYSSYEVSNCGRLRNKYNLKLKAIRNTPNGYLISDLKEFGVKKTKYIHRLVAEAFLSNVENNPCVNHKDENKNNNFLSNLEWCTVSYNNSYNDRAKKVGNYHKNHHPSRKRIININTGEVYNSVRLASRETGICNMSISYCIGGKQKTAGGFIWGVVN